MKKSLLLLLLFLWGCQARPYQQVYIVSDKSVKKKDVAYYSTETSMPNSPDISTNP